MIFFVQYRFSNTLVSRLSTKTRVDIMGTSPVRARGGREVGALRQMVHLSAYLCAHRLLCVDAVRKEEEEEEEAEGEEEGALLAGGYKSNEKISWVTQNTVNMSQCRKLLKRTGLKARLEKRDI